MRKLLLSLLLIPFATAAAQQTCVCTSGCVLVSDPYPAGASAPTTCNVYKAGVLYASGPVVLSSTVPTSNATSCIPPSATYNPGVAGSVACAVNVPPLVAGNYTLTMTAVNGAGETAQSSPFVFTSVAVLPALPSVPANLRIK